MAAMCRSRQLCLTQVLQALKRWHAEHTVKAAALMELRQEGVPLPILSQHIDNVLGHMVHYFQLKAAVVGPC